MNDDDEPMRLTGFVPVGDQDRLVSQEELDRAAPFNRHALEIFKRIPDDVAPGVIISVMAQWCLQFEGSEAAMKWLTDQAKAAIPRLRAAQTATRQ